MRILLCIVPTLIGWSAIAAASTLRVPADFPQIQSAITTASPTDTILIAPGTYFEALDLQGKWLVLRGEAGADLTVVDAQQLHRVVTMTGGGILEHLTLQNGKAPHGGGIHATGPATLVLQDLIVQDNTAGFFDSGLGGGIYLGNTTNGVIVQRSIVRNNYAGYSGGGIRCKAVAFPANIIRQNVVEGNGCHVAGGGIYAGVTEVTDNLVIRNWSDSFGGGIFGGGALIARNTVVGNFNNNNFLHGAGINVRTSLTRIENNVVAYNRGIPGIGSGAGIQAAGDIQCNNSWGNDGPDYLGADTTGFGNFSLDPLFCDPSTDNYSIGVGSPCAPGAVNECALIGAFPPACGVTPAARRTWGQVKAIYR